MELWLTNKKTLFPMISGKKKKKKSPYFPNAT